MAFFAEGRPITGTMTPDGKPLTFRWRMQEHTVNHYSMHWRVHTNWWTDNEIARDYCQVTTDTGWLIGLYRDVFTVKWFVERTF